jgi:tetratricopeptide (TPR) repeat protein
MNDRTEEAVKRTAVLITQVPAESRIEAQALQVMAYYRAGRYAEAKRYHEALSSTLPPESPLTYEVPLHAAWYHFDQKQYKQAIALLGPVASDCPEQAPCEDIMYLLSMSLFSDNQIKPASDQAGEFLSKYPFSKFAPAIHLKFGNALSSRNQYSEALVHYQEAAAAATDSTVAFDALKNTAIAYQKMLKWREAGDIWTQLAETFPDSPEMEEIRLSGARCKMEGGDIGGAIIAYQAAIPYLKDEGKARAYYWSGECHQRLGNHKAAVVQYLKVPYLVPREAMWGVTAQLKAAECYANMDRLDSAKNLYEKIVRQHGKDSQWGRVAATAIDQIDGTSEPEPQSEGEN